MFGPPPVHTRGGPFLLARRGRECDHCLTEIKIRIRIGALLLTIGGPLIRSRGHFAFDFPYDISQKAFRRSETKMFFNRKANMTHVVWFPQRNLATLKIDRIVISV